MFEPSVKFVKFFNRHVIYPVPALTATLLPQIITIFVEVMYEFLKQMEAMLARVLKSLEAQFIENGGLKEAMSRERRRHRGY